jgi:hypothetical protein
VGFGTGNVFGFGKGKELAGGLVVLADVGFRFRAKLRAKGFWGTGLAKQKAPPFFEGASVYSGGHSSHCGFRRGFPLRVEKPGLFRRGFY